MNKLLPCLLFFILNITFCNLSFSQDQKDNKQPLSEVLKILENRYNVKFSFETKTIEAVFIEPLNPKISLQRAIKKLSDATPLSFEVLNNRFIAITPKMALQMDNTTQHLDEIVINNYLAKGMTKTNNGAIEINAKTFDILPGLIEPDVLQILQNLPGIVSTDERISNLNIRGGTNDQNLILYEGVRMYQSGHFFGLISAFNPYLSEKINVSKNGTSAKFGDAVSSIITIENSNKIAENTKGGFGANLLGFDGFIRIPLSKKIELQLSARRSFTDLFSSPTYDAYFERIFRDSELSTNNTSNTLQSEDERFFFYDVNTKLLYNIDDSSKLRFNFVNIYNSLDYNQAFTDNNNNLQESKSALDQVSYGTSLSYSKRWKNGFTTEIEAYFSRYDLFAENNDVTDNQTLIQENEVNDYGIRLDISKRINKNIKLNGGYQLNEVGVSNLEDVSNPNFTSFSKEIIRTHALFSEAEWYSNSKKTYMRLGLRGSYFEKFSDFFLEPRLAFNQKFLKHFRLEVLGELKSQSLTQIVDLQQDFFGIEKRRWQLASKEDIPIIKSQQVSLGLSYSQNKLLISAEAYYKNVDDITARSQGFQNQYQFVTDIGSYSIKGVDVLINKRFSNFSTSLSYSYSNNDYVFRNLNEGFKFPNTVDLKHTANTAITYNLNNIRFALGINWHSGRPFTKPSLVQNDNNTDIEYETPNSSRLENYFRTDISAIYNFNLSKTVKAEFGASIWNLFNQINIINRYYKFNNNRDIVQIDNKSLKFIPNFSFRVSF